MNKEEMTNVINKLKKPENFNYYTNYGYAHSLLITDADTIIDYFEETQQQLDLYKSVIDEAREYMRENISRDVRYREDDNYICSDWIIKEPKKLLEILDKAKVGDE